MSSSVWFVVVLTTRSRSDQGTFAASAPAFTSFQLTVTRSPELGAAGVTVTPLTCKSGVGGSAAVTGIEAELFVSPVPSLLNSKRLLPLAVVTVKRRLPAPPLPAGRGDG